MVDLTHNQLLIKNSDNRFLNLIDFRNALKQGKTLFALRASRDSVAGHPLNPDTGYIENYYKKESPLLYYHEVDLNKVYSGNAKIKRYFFPVSWYEMYSGHPSFELLFYVKQLFILLWLAVCLRYVLQFFKK